MSGASWAVGLAIAAAGELLRLAGVAVAGSGTRRRSRAVHHLVTDGPFAWVRNPLYLGNGLAWLGVAVITGAPWLIPAAVAVFAIEYGLIVRYEEGVLESHFGAAYLAYKGRTGRWLPRPPGARPRLVDPSYDWRSALRSESSTFLNLGAVVAALALKALVARS